MALSAHCYDGQSSRMRAAQLDCVDGCLQLAFEDGQRQRWRKALDGSTQGGA